MDSSRRRNLRYFQARRLERYTHAQLSREPNPHSGDRAEEISQSAFRYLKLLQVGDGNGGRLRASIGASARTITGDVRDPRGIRLHLALRNRKLNHIDRVVRAGVIPVEQIEELDERIDPPALVDLEGTRHAQVGLDVRRAAENIEAGVVSIHIDAVGVVGVRDRDGARALDLIDGA